VLNTALPIIRGPPDGVATDPLQGLLAESEAAHPLARRRLHAVSGDRDSSEPHEPAYLHHLRDDVRAGHEARQIEIDATILFADLRGYTSLSQSQPSGAIAMLLDAFYDVCGEAIWEHDGIINKTMGDAVLAIFNFPMRHEDHAALAVAAARQIQELWRARREQLPHAFGVEAATIGVGIGLDTGKVNFGEFGRTHQDLTAIGTVVNVASRAQGAAAPDQILMTAAMREKAAAALPESAAREYQLKGIERPEKLWAA
jgi:adenylate cyclase